MPDTIDDAQEHPIIFNEWSIQRILAGEKTQTRRIADQDFRMQKADRVWKTQDGTFDFIFEDDTGMLRECPYGQPGAALWIREAFRLGKYNDDLSPSEYVWGRKTAGHPIKVKYEADGKVRNANSDYDWGRKRPSVHMPRELCRLRLRVEDVRVERAQEISAVDATALGYNRKDGVLRSQYRTTWNSIHGDGAWERNAWVWVIEFARYDE